MENENDEDESHGEKSLQLDSLMLTSADDSRRIEESKRSETEPETTREDESTRDVEAEEEVAMRENVRVWYQGDNRYKSIAETANSIVKKNELVLFFLFFTFSYLDSRLVQCYHSLE
jgi:hypothetical protein